MSVIRALAAALSGTVTASCSLAPPAEPTVLRELLHRGGLVRRTATASQVQAALRRFQFAHGLVVDGVAGPETTLALVRHVRSRCRIETLDIAA